MSDVKTENDKRTTKYLEDKARNGLVPKSHNIVSEKMRLANKSSQFSTTRNISNASTRYAKYNIIFFVKPLRIYPSKKKLPVPDWIFS